MTRAVSQWQWRAAQAERRERRIRIAKRLAFWVLVVFACVGVWALIGSALLYLA